MSTVRHAMSTLRYRWLDVRIGGPAATMRGQWRVVIVVTLFVFGCFFAIGRLSSTSGSAQLRATATEAPSSRPAIPAGLSGGPPSAGAVPTAILARPTPAPSPTTVASEASPTTTVASPAAQPTETQTPTALRAAPVSSTTPASKPAPSSATQQTSPKTGGTGNGTSTASPEPTRSHSAPSSSSSGNGSFDSSE